jgi:hypothetical protein
MDNVTELLSDLSKMPEIRSLERRASGFLNDVAEIYERDGAGVARAFLLNQRAKRREASLLERVIEKLESCPEVRTRRSIGRQIIKGLFELKQGAKP